MSDKLARSIRIFLGILGAVFLLPPFFAASEILDPSGKGGLLVFFALDFGEAWLAVLVHELGHAVAARCIGWRVHAIAVFPIAYLPRARRFAWSAAGSTGGIGGRVLATPARGGDDRRGAEAIYALGGVLANLASSAIVFALLEGRWLGHGAEPFLGPFAVLSFVIAVLNLVPVWGPGLSRMDGAHLLDALRGRRNPARERLLTLFAGHLDGVPPADWDADLIRQIEIDAESDAKLAAADPLLYLRHLDVGDLVRARAALARMAASSSDPPGWMKISEAFFLVSLDRNGSAAQEILDALGAAPRREFAYWQALAMARDALGDPDGARAAIEQARAIAAAKKLILKDSEREFLESLEPKATAPPTG